MAAQFVESHPGLVQGLVFWASYPGGTFPFSADLKVLSISGSNDGLAVPSAIEASKKELPANTSYVVIEGGNHGQFGSYGDQPGDNPATILPAVQWAETAAATDELLSQIGK
jgi:pimeloyl-ACP methyl ester carboxylesterase